MPRPKTIETLYHATYPDYAYLIAKEGIAPNEEGVINLCSNPYHAAGFIAVTGGRRFKGIDTITTENNRTYSVPSFDSFKTCVVYEIPMEFFDVDYLGASSEDFSSAFYPQDMQCFAYRKWISPDMCQAFMTLKLTDSMIPMKP